MDHGSLTNSELQYFSQTNMATKQRVLVKLRPSSALGAAESRGKLRPLYRPAPSRSLGLAAAADWYVAELSAEGASPWDNAHARVAEQLGVSESDCLFAEPDIEHTIYADTNEVPADGAMPVGGECRPIPKDGGSGKALGPNQFAWHLGDTFSGLRKAREAVEFSDPRTRIAHIDTGYYGAHIAVPEHVVKSLERNFVEGDNSAEDPDNQRLILDNSGHGTGTIGILAGGRIKDEGDIFLGGAPAAEVLPLRIADTVVLFRTSALAEAIRYATAQRCDVVTLSMGGLASRAWSEAVNEAYLAGICIAAAAGNNVNGVPTRNVVYPARYPRVIAVCGVMADGKPYVGLKGLTTLEGNFGPASSMTAAIAAYTPNIPWPVFGCPNVIRLNGEGTSAATPQVAAAAALWFEKYKSELPRDWRRVEAVRNALFKSATNKNTDPGHLGKGIMHAYDALKVKPVLGLPQSKADSGLFPFIRIITGLGVADPPPREQMFNQEIMQLWLLNSQLQQIVPDPEVALQLKDKQLKAFMEALIEDSRASLALRRHVASRYGVIAGSPPPRTKRNEAVVPDPARVCDKEVAVSSPPFRRLRVYAMDPSFSTRLGTAEINEVTLEIPWEDELKPGPSGEYLNVTDTDASGRTYTKVDLNDPRLLAQDGWHPSEGNPAFHQQMVYAVAMKTIHHFEQALGRPVLWRHGKNPDRPSDDGKYTPQLKVNPHALRQANAFYSPEEIALQFGYFEAGADDPGDHVPGTRVYTCLSHDIVAHETTHAILDGMHRRFNEPTNPDVLALHEAFADIVALMQHFTIKSLLEQEIGNTRGNLEAESTLGSLAVQFGRAIGSRGALRDAIGSVDENNNWTRRRPDPSEYQRILTPHSRGAILVAAVFDAFIAIYKSRTADLFRIYTGGTGVLQAGSIHPDLVGRLAGEAAKSANHVLKICIRALDYLPPVDITFGEYLRGLITADFDLVEDDRYNYRVAFVESFRRRGIYPLDISVPGIETLRTLSVDTLRWQGFDLSELSAREYKAVTEQYAIVVDHLKRYADRCIYLDDRQTLFNETRDERRRLHSSLLRTFAATPKFARGLGIDPAARFEVHELRPALRVSPDGRHIPQVIVSLTQSTVIPETKDTPSHRFRGGSTLVVDLAAANVRYRIRKNIDSTTRRERTASFMREIAGDPLRALMFAHNRKEPFSALHAFGDAS
jgi:subtilisin family serine protease